VTHEPRALSAAARTNMRRRLCAVVLTFEGFVVFFGALVASRLSHRVSAGTALAVGGGLALACILASGALRSRAGVKIGWIVQGLVVATGFVVPAMFVMGLLFAVLWLSALRIGEMVASGGG